MNSKTPIVFVPCQDVDTRYDVCQYHDGLILVKQDDE